MVKRRGRYDAMAPIETLRKDSGSGSTIATRDIHLGEEFSNHVPCGK
jgi:hypothetical protein